MKKLVKVLDIDFRVMMVDDEPVPLPHDKFSVRQVNSVWHGGKYYLFGDIVQWNNPHHPASYGSNIGVYSSPDGRKWTYHGLVLTGGRKGQWDYGGVATPTACRFRGKFYVVYSGRAQKDGTSERFLGLAMAEEPLGPFRKLPDPIFRDGCAEGKARFDDPCLVTRPGDNRLHLYYRHLDLDQRVDGHSTYTTRLRTTTDPKHEWSKDTVVLRPDVENGYWMLETVDVKWINGQFVLLVLDNFRDAQMWVSVDGAHFERCRLNNIEDQVEFVRDKVKLSDQLPFTAHIPGLLLDGKGECHFMNATHVNDSKGHYTQWIYRIRCNGGNATRKRL